LTSWS